MEKLSFLILKMSKTALLQALRKLICRHKTTSRKNSLFFRPFKKGLYIG